MQNVLQSLIRWIAIYPIDNVIRPFIQLGPVLQAEAYLLDICTSGDELTKVTLGVKHTDTIVTLYQELV